MVLHQKILNIKQVIKISILILFLTGLASCSQQDRNRKDLKAKESDELMICSFNIQFLGSFKKRDNQAIAELLKAYDIVLIQELVAPPFNGLYPDGEAYESDEEARAFFEAMIGAGFEYILSEEDTGASEEIHSKSSSTEWWTAFYKDEKVDYALDLPHGFLAEDRSNNEDFERVCYAFPFRSVVNDDLDFILISVHLAAGASEGERRKHELSTIAEWIDQNDELDQDFIILGDMNIEDSTELAEFLPEGYVSLNDECRRTNTLINTKPGNGAKPYDHVLYRPEFTSEEIDEAYDLEVVDLVSSMRTSWRREEPYPGDPYDHNLFKQYFSDHHPVVFRMGSEN